jgi:16S rRNA (cytosine1402-N4)-methyltransferase
MLVRVPQAVVDARLIPSGRRDSRMRSVGHPPLSARMSTGAVFVLVSGRLVQRGFPGAARFWVRRGLRQRVVFESRHGHEPVLVESVLRLLDPQPGDVVLDGTVGLGGHATALIPRIVPNGRYVGIDLDEEMLAAATERLATLPVGIAELFHANFTDFPDCLKQAGLRMVDHMLLDLGVNSAQLDDPTRGFSFDRDGPLDMRFDRREKRQALDLVNSMSERELADLFYQFGQEGASRKIAKRICEVRHRGRIRTTKVLAQAVESAFARTRVRPRGKIHPATRVFQSLRVYLNRELENLERSLELAPQYLRPGGKLAVISFHSLEDGIVKRFLRAAKASGTMTELCKRPVIADAAERTRNPRSRSAKLRVAQRTEA